MTEPVNLTWQCGAEKASVTVQRWQIPAPGDQVPLTGASGLRDGLYRVVRRTWEPDTLTVDLEPVTLHVVHDDERGLLEAIRPFAQLASYAVNLDDGGWAHDGSWRRERLGDWLSPDDLRAALAVARRYGFQPER